MICLPLLRNAGIGLCSSVARIGGISAPLIALLDKFGASIPYIIFGESSGWL